MYRIGEFSRLSQVPIRTLRYYDQIGLLVPAELAPSGYRGYSAEQLERLNRILVLKDLGLPLLEIRALLVDRASEDEIRGVLRDKVAELARRVATERARLVRAVARLALFEDGCASISDIAVRTTPACWVASVRAELRSHDDCDGLFDELAHGAPGLPRRRQRGAIWHACAPGRIDCEAFEIVPGPLAVRGRVAVRQLPAQRIAALVYRGDAEYLPAYRALRAWIGSAGLEIPGSKRELFLRSAGSVTEVQFPIARPAAARPARRAPSPG